LLLSYIYIHNNWLL